MINITQVWITKSKPGPVPQGAFAVNRGNLISVFENNFHGSLRTKEEYFNHWFLLFEKGKRGRDAMIQMRLSKDDCFVLDPKAIEAISNIKDLKNKFEEFDEEELDIFEDQIENIDSQARCWIYELNQYCWTPRAA